MQPDTRLRPLIEAMVANVQKARAVERPFFHLEFDRVFPDDIYAAMLDGMPDAADYRPLPGRNKGNILPDGTLDAGQDRPVCRIHPPHHAGEARDLGLVGRALCSEEVRRQS